MEEVDELFLPVFLRDPLPQRYLGEDYVVVDFETTNLNKGDACVDGNRLVFGYINSPRFGSIVLNNPEVDLLKHEQLFYDASCVVCHNGKFELKWLQRIGIKIERILLYDTMLGEYVRAGNRSVDLSLDATAERYGVSNKQGFVSRLIKAGVCPSTIPRGPLREYCIQDVLVTERIFLEQRNLLLNEGLLNVQYSRCLVTPLLSEVELRGLYLDKDVVLARYNAAIADYNKIKLELDAITGGINMASPAQVARFLYGDLKFEELCDRRGSPIRNAPNKSFPQGQPCTDEETIEKLRVTNARQRGFIKLRKAESSIRKQITSYLERAMYACGHPFTPMKNNKDVEDKFKSVVRGSNMIHGKILQGFTQTHRLSSREPNLQNQDRDIKSMFAPRHAGWSVVNADYKTLEMTVAGMLAQDKQCLTDILTKHDFHIYTGQVILSKEDITKDERTGMKKHTFKPLYFGNSGTDEEMAYYKAFRERYSGITGMQQGWIDGVLKTKKHRTCTGLVLYWPDTEYTRSGYVINSTSIANYEIQYFATGEIAPIGTVILWHYLKALGLSTFVNNLVHDSVVLEAPAGELLVLGNLIEKALSKDVTWFFKKLYNYNINYPLAVEIEHHNHWGEDL